MIAEEFKISLRNELEDLKQKGLFKKERVIVTPQKAVIKLENGQEVINLCANNYLGLADHPDLIHAAKNGLDHYGFGLSSVRFICGTQNIHKELEKKISEFLQMEDTILYSSCFDANGGLFETLFTEEDVIFSDALNHASIIDGIRLCKAKRKRYQNNNMTELEEQLKISDSSRRKCIVTDGVFSMDGTLANLPKICDLAEQYNALVVVDDSHAVGFMGANGRGTPEYHQVMGRIDIYTGTLGKALGGASGGYTSASKEIVSWLRQRSRPYLFSNSLAPVVVATSIKAFELIQSNKHLLQKLKDNTAYFHKGLEDLGFRLSSKGHPIIPILLGDATLASTMADLLLQEGVYVIGFSYPVVPLNEARIRTQMSAAHDIIHLDKALNAFAKIGKDLNVIH